MSALLESVAAGLHGDAARVAEVDAIVRDGLPTTHEEAWKYTSLRMLGQRHFLPAAEAEPLAIHAERLAGIPAPRMVFVNGRFDAALSRFDDLPAGVHLGRLADTPDATRADRYLRHDEVFARLNAAVATDGLVLRVESGTRMDSCLHLVVIGAPTGSDLAWHLRHRIELGQGATLHFTEHHLAGADHAHLGNVLTEVQLAAGASLQHLRIQREATRASLIARTDAVLAEDASYRRLDLELGAELSRHEFNVRLLGDRASLLAHGTLLAEATRHLDTRLDIRHIARDTSCDLLWRGLAGGRGRAVFHGGITIQPGADGSEARLSSKNLLLNPGAEIDAQPVLEIHADEVKAAHGATVGQLDDTALFYLRSRGLPAAQARTLLTGAFCRATLAALDAPGMSDDALHALDAALARMEEPA